MNDENVEQTHSAIFKRNYAAVAALQVGFLCFLPKTENRIGAAVLP